MLIALAFVSERLTGPVVKKAKRSCFQTLAYLISVFGIIFNYLRKAPAWEIDV
jgi:hypothetical protein